MNAQGTSQSVLDALADAETLRLVAHDLTYWDEDVVRHAQAITMSSELWIAKWQGGRSSVLDETIATPDLAAACARIAADAAFRACPGLREPKS